MNKLMLASIIAIAAISGLIGYSNKPSDQQLSAIALANLEALSHDEDLKGYESVREMYDYVITELPDGTVIQDWVYLGKDCSGKGHLPC